MTAPDHLKLLLDGPAAIDREDARRQADAESIATAPDGWRLSDVGNAHRLIELSEHRIRYAHGWDRWLVYRGGRWRIDNHGAALVTEYAKKVAPYLFRMSLDLHGELRDAVLAAAKRAESSFAISGMLKMARGMPGVIVEHEDLDADPYLLNVRNGTIDLRTGELRPHDPADLCTKQVQVAYDPDAKASLWDTCLVRWQPDEEIREYLHREAGAGATGRPTETLSIFYGPGGNGKSKYVGALMGCLGDYAVIPHKSLIVAFKHEQHATVVASLFRSRLAVASETTAGARLNEEQVKNLTGGDRLAARRMREDEWSFDPTHTLVMVTNNLPDIRGTDESIWRRVRMIPWTVTIPSAERDVHLAAKLRAESAGILAWIVGGAVTFLADGLTPPGKIVASTDEYREQSDTPARFLSEAGVVADPRGRISTVELTELHEAWVEENGVTDRNHWRRVVSVMKKMGAKAAKSHGTRFWDGVASSKSPAQSERGTEGTPVPVNQNIGLASQLTGTSDPSDPRIDEDDLWDELAGAE